MILSSVVGRISNLHCSTYGVKKSGDIKIAGKIAKKFGIEHYPYVIGDKQYIKDIPEKINDNINIFNGLIPLPFQLHWIDFCKMNEIGNKTMMLGIMGDEVKFLRLF
jgi:asparagine synthetase B (glutamine-hydrolysing)